MNKLSMDVNSFFNEIPDYKKTSPKKNYKDNVELRRDSVQRLLVQGNTQWEIAESLDVSQTTVSRDIQWLRTVAKKELKDMIEKKFPEEFHKYLVGIDEVLRHAWNIALTGDVDKTRLEALQFVIDCSRHRMGALKNPPVLTRSNNHLKPFKANIYSDDDSLNNSNNGFNKRRKQIKKKESLSEVGI